MKGFEELINEWLDFEQFKEQYQQVPVEEYSNNVLRAIPEPKLSVRLTTYQHVNYIREAINGVLMQETDFPFEIIIGDDESTDGTRDICIEYAEKYPDKIRLFLHKRENNISVLGKPTGIFQVSYNTLNCRGKYIAGCSGDDYWQDSTKLHKQIQYLNKNPKTSFTYHDHARLFTESGEIKGPFPVERTQTVVGRNIFSKLPDEFLSVMQEDTFFKFYWKRVGVSNYIPKIRPSVVRFHPKSMYTSISEEDEYQQKKNLWSKIIDSCYEERQYKKVAKIKFIDTIFYHYRNKKELSIQNKIKNITLELFKYNLLMIGIRRIAFNIFKKFYR